MPTEFTKTLKLEFNKNSDAIIAQAQSAYMRNLFPYFGLKKDTRAEIQKIVFKQIQIADEQELIAVVKELWSLPQRELHYAAQELCLKYKKLWSESILDLFEFMIRTNSWWDTVDFISVKLVGQYLVMFPDQIHKIKNWHLDSDIWIARTSIIFQLFYKTKTNTEMLFSNCLHLAYHKDFFIRKAIGWALRQHSKIDEPAIRNFLKLNGAKFSGLSIREASKYLRE